MLVTYWCLRGAIQIIESSLWGVTEKHTTIHADESEKGNLIFEYISKGYKVVANGIQQCITIIMKYGQEGFSPGIKVFQYQKIYQLNSFCHQIPTGKTKLLYQ